MKPGDCFVDRSSRTVLCLITKTRHSDPPSLTHLENCFRKLDEHINQLRIKKLAFAKYENGLDKLNWNHVSELLNRSFTNNIQCTVYLNKSNPVEITDDLDINTKIKKLQKQDAQISQLIDKAKRHKLKGYVIENDILFKLRKAKNRLIFKQLVVPAV